MNRKPELFFSIPIAVVIILSLSFLEPIETDLDPSDRVWTVTIQDGQDIVITKNGQIICAVWKIPIPESVSDQHCITRSGFELKPVSQGLINDDGQYDQFLNQVVDTMKVIAIDHRIIYSNTELK